MELVTLIDSLRDNEVNLSVTSATATGYVALKMPPEDLAAPRGIIDQLSQTPDAPDSCTRSRFAEALQRLDNDEELLREQMQFFLKDGPKLVTMATTAIASNSAADLQIAAHRLKNLCATFDDDKTARQWGEVEAASVARSFISGETSPSADSAIAGTNTLVAAVLDFLS